MLEKKDYLSNRISQLSTRLQRLLFISVLASIPALSEAQETHEAIVWRLGDKRFVKELNASVLGEPSLRKENKSRHLWFDGKDDGLIIQGNPIESTRQFTIEMLFKPDGDGPVAPRMMHFQDKTGNRGTFEARLVNGKLWYLDTFLKNGPTNKGVTLIDSTKTHPVDQWYWLALVFDGKTMSSYVNGNKELEAVVDFPGLSVAETALGVRLNKVSWFKGGIKEVRFTRGVLSEVQLKRFGQ